MGSILIHWTSLALALFFEMVLHIRIAIVLLECVAVMEAGTAFFTKVIASQEALRIGYDVVMILVEK